MCWRKAHLRAPSKSMPCNSVSWAFGAIYRRCGWASQAYAAVLQAFGLLCALYVGGWQSGSGCIFSSQPADRDSEIVTDTCVSIESVVHGKFKVTYRAAAATSRSAARSSATTTLASTATLAIADANATVSTTPSATSTATQRAERMWHDDTRQPRQYPRRVVQPPQPRADCQLLVARSGQRL